MKKAIIYLDDGSKEEIILGEILENEVNLIEKHIINNKFFKAYNEYINIQHIIKIEVIDDINEILEGIQQC